MFGRRPYKGNKLEENALTPCCKCDCLILSDSSDPNNDKCIRIKKTPKDKNISPYYEELDDSDRTPSLPKTTDSVKVSVKLLSDEESIDKSTSTSERNHRVEATQTDEKKHLCFKFCRRKNKKKETKNPPKDNGIQTSKVGLKTTKVQSSDVDLDDFVNNATKFGKPNAGSGSGPGNNTNTIIFQKDQASGDGVANLENWLKMETRTTNRNLEDILNELHKQKRDMQEIKEMLDTIVRGFRDHLFATTFGKGKPDFYGDPPQKKLERKSNTLSIKRSGEVKSRAAVTEAPIPSPSTAPEEKKKKRFFSWCP